MRTWRKRTPPRTAISLEVQDTPALAAGRRWASIHSLRVPIFLDGCTWKAHVFGVRFGIRGMVGIIIKIGIRAVECASSTYALKQDVLEDACSKSGNEVYRKQS